MIFVPSTVTYHGFEPRKIEGVRKSPVINYVTKDGRARNSSPIPSSQSRLSKRLRAGTHGEDVARGRPPASRSK